VGHLTDYEIAALRSLANDEQCGTLRRLQAIDRLACDANLYFVPACGVREGTERFATEYRKCGTRARREVIRLLRKLNKSKKRRESQASAIQARLLFLRGISLTRGLFRLNEHGERVYCDEAVGTTNRATTSVSKIDIGSFDDALRSVEA
jgi:hypothetical protein